MQARFPDVELPGLQMLSKEDTLSPLHEECQCFKCNISAHWSITKYPCWKSMCSDDQNILALS